jgi:hypothetical protein
MVQLAQGHAIAVAICLLNHMVEVRGDRGTLF